MLAVLLEVFTMMSIPFIPSMPTMRMNLNLVRPLFLLWYINFNVNLNFLLGINLSFLSIPFPTVNPFYTEFVPSVLAGAVLFPAYMTYLGLYKTAADQAGFVHLGFEAAAMFLTKQVASGLICTDYSDRDFVRLHNLSLASVYLEDIEDMPNGTTCADSRALNKTTSLNGTLTED